MRLLSIVLPVYNEEEVLPVLRKRLTDVAAQIRLERKLPSEIILVDDGSKDLSPQLLASWAAQDPTVRVIGLSRNFGHQAAITAGLDAARGDAVITMDADLQDPPEVIPRLLAKAEEGYEVVYARRQTRAGESLFKRGTAWLFYRTMRLLAHRDLPADTGDFRLLSGSALEAFRALRERHRFLRGMSAWIGFRQAEVAYSRSARPAGRTKFSTLKMAAFAWDAVVSFSTLPLRIAALWGAFVSLFGVAYLLYTIYRFFVHHDTVPGWATLIVLLCLIGGSILVSLGILGSYIGKVFEELKGRPLYIVRSPSGSIREEGSVDPRLAERVELSRRVGL